MSIDIEVHGDPDAITAVGTMVQEMSQALTDAAGDLTTLRGEADGAWDGYASQQVLLTFERTQSETEQFATEAQTLATAVSALGTTLAGVVEDMAALRSEAIGEGLPTTATTIEFPDAAAPDASPEAVDAYGEKVDAFYRLQGRADGYREAEEAAHQAMADAVGAFLASPLVLDVLQRVGFAPSGGSPHDIGTWLTGLGLTGVGWSADWWTKLKTGIYRPRAANGQWRTAGTGWREALASTRSNNWGARANQAVTNKRWAAAGKWAGRVGTAISFGTAAWGQWQEDADDPAMGWEEKGARAATVGAATAAGGWAGAAAGAKGGAAIGFLIGGPVGSAIGGIAGGLIGGAVGAGLGEKVGDWAKKGVGKFVDSIAFWK